MVTWAELPETCPCGGWPRDPGTPIPELPGFYNHFVLTHKVELSGEFWAPVADLPRIKTHAERVAERAIRERARKRWAAADREWKRLQQSPSTAFHDLVTMHRPTLDRQDTLRCSFCTDEFGHDPAEWPCEHYSLLAQLAQQ